MSKEVINHYDLLVEEGNDPVFDPPLLKEHMNIWDGQAFIQSLMLTGKEDVLEIGVGTGRLAIKLCADCKNFTGIDISEKTIMRAKKNLSAHKNTKLINADFMEYSFKSQFDVIYSSLTFMHIKNKLLAIKKTASLLNQNGRFVLSIDNDPSNIIDYGTRIVSKYPSDPDYIADCIAKSDITIIHKFSTEFATIFVSIKK